MQADKQVFSRMMDDLALLYGKTTPDGQAAPTPLKKMYWADLGRVPIQALEVALSAHRRDPERGRFFPTPADVMYQIEQLQPGDGRLDANEAWSVCLEALDEGATLAVTAEIMIGRAVAKPIFDAGDKIAARMAFKSAYERAVLAARQAGVPMRWTKSIGNDPTRREEGALRAVALGRLTRSEIEYLLPAPPAEGVAAVVAGLLTGSTAPVPDRTKAIASENLERVREVLQMRDRVPRPTKTPAEFAAEKARAAAWLDNQEGASA